MFLGPCLAEEEDPVALKGSSCTTDPASETERQTLPNHRLTVKKQLSQFG